jgi:hypothetical protein
MGATTCDGRQTRHPPCACCEPLIPRVPRKPTACNRSRQSFPQRWTGRLPVNGSAVRSYAEFSPMDSCCAPRIWWPGFPPVGAQNSLTSSPRLVNRKGRHGPRHPGALHSQTLGRGPGKCPQSRRRCPHFFQQPGAQGSSGLAQRSSSFGSIDSSDTPEFSRSSIGSSGGIDVANIKCDGGR